MAPKNEPEPVKAFVAILSGEPSMVAVATQALVDELGPVDYSSEPFPFDHTPYYQEEMGRDLKRQFVAFQNLIDPGILPTVKTVAYKIEEDLSRQGQRTVNLDPGYMDFNKVVLASYKYGGQKVYLQDGVYGDMVLLYAKGRFEPLPWTFPDFLSGTYQETLLKIRRKYKTQRRSDNSILEGSYSSIQGKDT